MRIRIVLDCNADFIDQPLGLRPAAIEHELWPSAEPIIVGTHPVHPYRWSALFDAKANHLVARKARRSRRFDYDPGMHRENAPPSYGAGSVDLDHSL